MNSKQKTNGYCLKIFECILYLLIINLSYISILKIDIRQAYFIENMEAYLGSVFLITLFSLIILVSTGTLHTFRKSKEENIVLMVFNALLIGISTMSVVFFTREFAMPRSTILLGIFVQIFGFSIVKLLIIEYIKRSHDSQRIAIICSKENLKVFYNKVMTSNQNDYITKAIHTSVILPENIDQYFKNVDVIFMSDFVDPDTSDFIFKYCIKNDIQLNFIPRIYEIGVHNSDLKFTSDLPYLKMSNMSMPVEKQFIKRCFDLICSILGIVLLSPIMLIVSIVSLLIQGRPVIYKQKRVTKGNRLFTIYKFRTMVNDAEKETGAVWADKDDPRITPYGKFLRRFWIDELPQLFNVFLGHMSMVGPRPERPELIDVFSESLPEFRYRLKVKAGVTGYAQILGKYDTKPETKIKFDLIYIQKASLYFDIQIVLQTVKKVILGTLTRDGCIDDCYESHKLSKKITERNDIHLNNLTHYDYQQDRS